MSVATRRPVIPVWSQRTVAAPDAAPRFPAPPPLSLYVHVPWCVRKCPYCDFNSHALPPSYGHHQPAPETPNEAAYVAALTADLESALPLVWGRRIDSVFIGGGTPSLLSGAAVDRLLAVVRSYLPLRPDAEITLEANPGTAEAARFAAFRAAGVNRLSLGVQTFNPRHLHALGRIHDDREAVSAIELASRCFDNVNLDLMYGLPGQSIREALADVERALAFAPAHLSCYQLTIEPNTAFAADRPVLPDPDTCGEMHERIEARLGDAGYAPYEIAAFAQPGRRCRHNLNYWYFGDYLGIGAGAHSKLTLHDRVLRQMRWKHPERYLSQAAGGTPIQEEFVVEAAELPGEFMLNALRLRDGFPASLFEQRTGLPLLRIETTLRQAEADGLLDRGPSSIVATDLGRRFLNRLVQRFLVARP